MKIEAPVPRLPHIEIDLFRAARFATAEGNATASPTSSYARGSECRETAKKISCEPKKPRLEARSWFETDARRANHDK